MKRLEISFLLKIQYNTTTKNAQKIKTNKQYAKHNKKHENKHPQKVNVEKLYKKVSCGIRTHANITDRMAEVLHVSTALLFLFI